MGKYATEEMSSIKSSSTNNEVAFFDRVIPAPNSIIDADLS